MLIEWIHCPICGGKTRNKIRGDTELRNYPLYCPKCKKESLIDVKRLQVTVIKEPDAKTQSSNFIASVFCDYIRKERDNR